MTTTPVNGSGAGKPTHKTIELVEIGTQPNQEKLFTVVAFGLYGTGKTRFAVTFPGPLGVIALNSKCRATMENVRDAEFPGKKIYFPKQDLIRHAKPMQLAMMKPRCTEDQRAFNQVIVGIDEPACCTQHYYRWHMNRVKDAVFTMTEDPRVKTIIIDDCTIMYDDILFANFGRNNQISDKRTSYAVPNREMVEIITAASARKHTVLLAKGKYAYVNDKRTNQVVIEGYEKVGFDSTVILHMRRDEKTNDFYADVQLCQERASLNGDAGKELLTNDEINFATLAAKIFGNDDNFLEVFMEYQEKCQ